MNAVWKFFQFVSDKMRVIGAFLLIAMTVLTCADVIGRFFKSPVFGAYELMYLMGAIAIAMALPDTHINNGHIGVELFVTKLPRKPRAIIEIVTGLLSLALFSIVTYKMFEYSFSMRRSGEVSMNLGLPEYTIIFVVACSFIVFTIFIIRTIVQSFDRLRGK
jgi:TRAP-type C4-dicarboxylate transport system permease small subunit